MSRSLMTTPAALVAALLAVAPGIDAQPQPLTFEVASVKPHQADDTRRALPQFLAGGRFQTQGVPLRMLIATAYGVGFQSVRLTGGPDWIASSEGTYDIEAAAPKGAITDGMPKRDRDQKMQQMLQSLLADRFKLKVRRDGKEMPVYALVVGKGGPKLDKAKVEEKDCATLENATTGGKACHSLAGGRGRGLHGEAVSLSDVLSYVENWTDRPLLDKTGLSGLFNIQTRGWAPSQPGPPPPPGAKGEDGQDLADQPTLFEVFERLGLKLEPQRGVADIFVIEHVERPTGN
jgi:uncharacterized protein (TIGR03435 family)